MRDVLALAVAGAAGTVSRYALSGWSYRLFGDRFPYGTLVVNVVGCVLLGLFMEIALGADLVPQSWRLPVAAGFFGAFTTFSTFGYETMRYLEEAAWGAALANIAANVFFCLAAMWLGLTAGRALVGVGGS